MTLRRQKVRTCTPELENETACSREWLPLVYATYPPCRSSKRGNQLQSEAAVACRSLYKWRRRWCDVQTAMTSLFACYCGGSSAK